MNKSNLVIFLITLNFGFFLLISFLFAYLVFQKYRNARYERLKTLRFREWGDGFAELIVNQDPGPARSMLERLPVAEYELFIEFISVYLGNIKGAEFDCIVDLIVKSEIYDFFRSQSEGGSIDNRIYSTYCLGLLRKNDSAGIVARNLRDRNVLLRIVAAQALARMKCFSALGDILEVFNTERLLHFYKTGEILWEFGAEGCEHFVRILEEYREAKIMHEKLYVIGPLVEVLGRFKYSGAAPIVMDVLEHTDDDQVIRCCIESIGRMVFTDALPVVENYLKWSDPAVRIAAINAVYDLIAYDHSYKIRPLLDDNEWEVRYAAANALYNMKFDLRGYMFDPEMAGSPRALRTVVHLLTEKNT